ncbi:MAG: FAD-dependent oxidoreductase [Candidatus Wallbacteria bacterium]|nr:FAD-dependent oxidoreductase [Candidatus Wallbacteria bacterium]
MAENRKRVLIVGGVAAGASCAARLRRLDEAAEIVVFERGPYVSFANCGLPYHVGNVIPEEKSLLVASAELFRQRFRIDVRTRHEVTAVDRAAREISVTNLQTGSVARERYDALVLAPGAAPVRPPLPGLDLPGIFTLRTIPDSRAIREWIDGHAVQRATIVGAGFIGLEMAENLAARGIRVSMVEMLSQVLPPLDPEMAVYVAERLRERGVELHLDDAVASFASSDNHGLVVSTQSGKRIETDMVVLSIGVRPETTLARNADLPLGPRGGIAVDDRMQTSDPAIWAVGDAVEVRDVVSGQDALVPLAGPANRQGRIAAASITGNPGHFRGVQATAVCGAFGLTAALTGASEKSLRRAGITTYEKVYLHPSQHAGYYPGATPIRLKLLFDPKDGRLLGAQAVGDSGVEKRIDVLAMALQMGATVHDLAEAELCYAPQYGSAKDPVNLAGMVAVNALEGLAPLARWEDVQPGNTFLLDVREPAEFAAGAVESAHNVPLGQLRDRLSELPRDRELLVYCGVGQRAHSACRLLAQNGFAVRNLSGGFLTWRAYQAAARLAPPAPSGPGRA